jgi:hypothetical protein
LDAYLSPRFCEAVEKSGCRSCSRNLRAFQKSRFAAS